MKIINNITEKLSDELKQDLRAGSRLSIAAACFSVYAFEELKTQLLQIDALRFIFTSPTFLAEQPKQEQREFYIPRRNREKALHGSEFEIRLRNAFTQRAISKECADWIRQKAVFKSNSTDEQMPGFLTVDGDAPSAYAPISGFTRAELGCERGGNMFSMINKIEAPESKAYLTLFDQLWADRRKMKDVTEQVSEVLADRPRKVEPQLFLGKDLQNANGEPVRVTKELADAIYEDLIQNGYVRRGELTDKYYTDKQNGTVQVAAEVQDCAASVVHVLSSIFDGRSMLPEDANGGNVEAHLDPEKLKKKEFLALWNRINHKSVYTVSFDTQELIQNSIRELDEKLDVAQVVIRKEYGEQADHLTSKEQLENGEGFRKTKTDQQTPETAPLGSVRYDLIGKLVEETGLTRASIATILQGMSPLKFAMFRNNPEAFILKVGRIINNQKATMIVEHITYNRLEAAYDSDIFAAGKLRGKLNVSAMRAEKSLYDHVIYDSENERKFAGELDISEKVAVYVKLPSSFFISTPVGHYNPDWAIAFTEGSVRHIFFVAETKGNTDSLELRGVENAKIECARRHFAAISNEEVVYEVVDSFEKLMQKVI